MCLARLEQLMPQTSYGWRSSPLGQSADRASTTREEAIAAVKREAWNHSFGPNRDVKQQQALRAAVALLEQMPVTAP